MKFAYGNMRKACRKHGTTAAFFFNARGDYIERSVPGMYRSLLLQLLQGVPEVQSVVDNLDFEYQDLNECLQLDHLKEIFCSAILALGQQPFTCFIDALDECDEQQVMDMIRLFEELGTETTENGIKFRICFSSRHYPYIFMPKSIDLTLENQLGHTKDLAAFVGSRFRIRDTTLHSQLQADILQKASGVFLRVSLVVDILNEQHARGGMDLRKRLKEIPGDLHALFKDMLRRDAHNKEGLLLSILWILCAKRPLKTSEFSHALWSGLIIKGQADDEPPNLTTSNGSDVANRFVIGSSKGLAEVTQAKDSRVQFIHESVRDFLLKSGGLKELWPDLGYDWQFQAHERLKECCKFYLEYPPIRDFASQLLKGREYFFKFKERTSAKFPFLEYASRHILGHADISEEAIPQQDLLCQFPIQSWIAISNHFQGHHTRRYTVHTSLLYILADRGHANLIRQWLTKSPETDVFDKTTRFRYPLFAALANGNKSLVAALINVKKTAQDVVGITEGLNHIKDLKGFIGRTPLSWAAQEGRIDMVGLLLRNGSSPSEIDGQGHTALLRASRSGRDEVVKMLLEHGANFKPSSFATIKESPIFWASTGVLVELLKEKGAYANIPRKSLGEAFLHMSHVGNETGLQALIECNDWIDVASQIHATNRSDEETPLIKATKQGHEAVARLLIQHGANIRIGYTILGRDALQLAIIYGHPRLAKLYIQLGADVNGQSSGESTISLAFKSRHMGTAKLLIDAGVDLFAEVSSGNTTWAGPPHRILIFASKFGQASIVEFLLRDGGGEDISGAVISAALKVAQAGGHATIAETLMSAGAIEDYGDEYDMSFFNEME